MQQWSLTDILYMEEWPLHIFKSGLVNVRSSVQLHEKMYILTSSSDLICFIPLCTDILSNSRKNCNQVSSWKMKENNCVYSLFSGYKLKPFNLINKWTAYSSTVSWE